MASPANVQMSFLCGQTRLADHGNRVVSSPHLLRRTYVYQGVPPGRRSSSVATVTAWYVSPVTVPLNEELIRAAEAALNPHTEHGRLFGNVAAALVTTGGNRYLGVCIDTGSGTGLCAEHAAVAAMVTAGEYRVARIVAVWRDEAGRLYVLPPCGRCREFVRQIDAFNLDTEVVLGRERSVPLRELLPHHEWPDPLD